MISGSDIPVKCLTTALRELPCATTITFLFSRTDGQIVSFQKGKTLSIVVSSDSVYGRASSGKSWYYGANLGCLSSSKSKAGGGML